MKSQPFRRLMLLLPMLLTAWLAGCGGNSDGNSGEAQVRLLNLSTGYQSLDLFRINEDSDTDESLFTSIALGSVSSYATLKSDVYTLKFRRSGTSGNLHMANATLVEDLHVTYVAHGELNRFAVLGIDDSTDPPASGNAHVQVLNISTVGALDLYLTGSDDSLDDVSSTVSGLPAGSQTAATVTSGTYRLRVVSAGSKSDIKLNVPSLTLGNQAVLAIILANAEGGVLVKAVVLPRRGQPTTYDNAGDAFIRLVNASTGYETLDLVAEGAGTTVNTPTFAGVTRGFTTAYASARADTYTLKFRRTGTSGNLLSTSATLAEGLYTTYVTYGTTNRFGVLSIGENVAAAETGYTSLQVLNATSSDELDVYLTGADDVLDNVVATIPAVAAGASSTRTAYRSDAYRLRITGRGDKADLRLDVPEVVLQSQAVVTLVLTDTHGGVLVNALLMPQRGEPVRFDNQTVRLRAAVGVSAGASATVNVAGTDILTRRPARSFFSAGYGVAAPGNAPVTVYIDDVPVATETLLLEAGRDYTLLVWDAGGTVRTTLVTDDNYVAAGERAKVRLLHGMSGLAAPLSMSMDYLPVAEFIPVGGASGYADFSPGNAYRLDVTDAQTLASVLLRESVTLQSEGVYTFFVAGGGGSAAAGTLRKDR